LAAGEHQGDGAALTQGRGCSVCRATGYRGCVCVFELLMVDNPVRAKVEDRSKAAEIRDEALTLGMGPLRNDRMAKILGGQTTIDEVSCVTVQATM